MRARSYHANPGEMTSVGAVQKGRRSIGQIRRMAVPGVACAQGGLWPPIPPVTRLDAVGWQRYRGSLGDDRVRFGTG